MFNHRQLVSLVLGIITPIVALADRIQCNPVEMRELGEKFAIVALCSTGDNASHAECVNYFLAAGLASIVIGEFGPGLTGSQMAQNTAARADMLRTRRYFSTEARRLIDNIKAGGGSINDVSNIIKEFKKHPLIFQNSNLNFSKALTKMRGGVFLRGLGIFALIGTTVSEMFLTTPEECEVLNLPGILEQDKKWISYGWQCSRYINTDFFSLNFEQQLSITDRSPGLCEGIPPFAEDLERIIRNL